MLRIFLLGRFSLERSGDEIDWSHSARLQSLLAYLLLHRKVAHSRESIATMLWPEVETSRSRGNLRHLLHRLKKHLPSCETWVHITRHTLQWNNESPFALDVDQFRENIAQSNNPDALREGLSWSKGPLVPDCFDDWMEPIRRDLQNQRSHAVIQLGQMLEEKREYEEALSVYKSLQFDDPLFERATYRIIRLYALLDQRVEALKLYQEFAARLEEEFGSLPNEEWEDLILRIQGDNDELSEPERPQDTLVGRSEIWARLLEAWEHILSHQTQIVILQGESGIGKTAILNAWSQWVQKQAVSVLQAKCYEMESSLLYTPIVNWLRGQTLPELKPLWKAELSRLLPEIQNDSSEPTTLQPLQEAWQKHRLFEAIGRTLLRIEQPLVLLLDDIQWCDSATLECLHFLVTRLATNSQVLLVASLREHVHLSQDLDRFFNSLEDTKGLLRLTVPPLSQEESRELIHSRDPSLSDSQIALLLQETEGNPLFLVELLRSNWHSKLAPNAPATAEKKKIAPIVQEAMKSRLEHLSKAAYHVVTVAAVMGREFSLEVLMRASEEEYSLSQVANALEECCEQNILQEQQESYRFSHGSLAVVAYQSLKTPRRYLFHQQVANAMEHLYSHCLDSVAASIAYHFRQGRQPERAREYYRKAVLYSHEQCAHPNARNLCLQWLEVATPEQTLEVKHLHAKSLIWLGQWEESEQTCLRQIELAKQASNDLALAHANRMLGQVYNDQERYEETYPPLFEALSLFESLEQKHQTCDIYGILSKSYIRERKLEEALDWSQRMLSLAQQESYSVGIANALGNLGDIFRLQGQYPKALDYCVQRYQLAQSLQDLLLLSKALNVMGAVYFSHAESHFAIECYQRALQTSLIIGHRLSICSTSLNLSSCLVSEAQWDAAEAFAHRAIRLAQEMKLPNVEGMSHTVLSLSYTRQAEASKESHQSQLFSQALAALERSEPLLLNSQHIFYNTANRVRLQFRCGTVDAGQASQALRMMLPTHQEPYQKAWIHYLLWQIEKNPADQEQAASLYRQIYKEDNDSDYAEYYKELTGNELERSAPLAAPPWPTGEAVLWSDLTESIDDILLNS